MPKRKSTERTGQPKPRHPDGSGVWSSGHTKWSETTLYAIHDARNHVVEILASIDFLKHTACDQGEDSEVARELSCMKASCRQLAFLLKEALASARDCDHEIIGSDQELKLLVEASVARMRQYAASRCGVEVEIVQASGSVALGEAPLVLRVIDNLLHNAIEQSPPRGTVRIGWVVANGQVTVEVSDEGPGIDEGEVEQIFEPFVSSSDHGADGEHVGLGLSFCRAVAHAYGGDVLGRNGERGGAVFTFSIPVPTTDSAEAQEAERLEVAS